MAVVACRRRLFTRGSNCKALTGTILVFWIGGCLGEVASYEKWLHVEGGLFYQQMFET